jgi:transposase InsO family protein/transposase-like protein
MDEQNNEKSLASSLPAESSPPHIPKKPSKPLSHMGPYDPDKRREAVEAFHKSSMNIEDFSRVWGVGKVSLRQWLKRYDLEGPKGLERKQYKRMGRPRRPGMREEIAEVQRKYPDFGLRKVKDFLFRYHGVKVSTGSVRNTLREKGLNSRGVHKRRRKIKPPRRFERANAGDLWQTDITSFVLPRRSERIYLTVFLDDYSRYIVSWGLSLRQTQDFVIETLLDGIERFGKPKEVLSDQGRQYFAWRGKGDFQKLLIREGIQHVVARTHHPQTVGKTERFWGTVGEEFWDRVHPQDFTEAKERFGHFVAHYNHFRPHQGIDGMVPADRLFGAVSKVREALEKTMSRNELHLAIGEKPRKPVFLVGQVGDQQISLHGENGRLVFQTQDGKLQEMGLEELGVPGGKNGTGNTEVGSDNAGGEEKTQLDAPKESKVQVAQRSAQIHESPVGFSDGGGKTEGAPSSGSHSGKLDGTSHEAGSGEKVGDAAAPGMADVSTGAGGPSGGPLETTQSQEGEITTFPPAGGRSEGIAETDNFSGERPSHDEGANRSLEGISSPSGGETGN